MRMATKELQAQGGESLSSVEYEKQLQILIRKYEQECNEHGIEHLTFPNYERTCCKIYRGVGIVYLPIIEAFLNVELKANSD